MRPMTDGRKKRRIYAGVGVAALAIPATAAALTAGSHASRGHAAAPMSSSVAHEARVSHRSHPTALTAAQRGCATLVTVRTAEHAANRIYWGTRAVTRHNLKALGSIERCQRNPAAERFVRDYVQRRARSHRLREAAARAAARAAREQRRRAAARAARERRQRQAAARAAREQQQREAAQQAAAAQSQATQTSSATASAASAGSSPLPTCTWLPESGGNPSAVNPTSGAGGYYQIMPSTWQAYGGSGLPQDAPLAEQTAIAEKIWATQGPSAWVNC